LRRHAGQICFPADASPGLERPECEVDYAPPFAVYINNTWSITFTPKYGLPLHTLVLRERYNLSLFPLLDVINCTTKRNICPTLLRNAVGLPVRLFTLSTIELGLLCLTEWKRQAVEAGVQSLTYRVLCVVDKVTLGQPFRLPSKHHPTTVSMSFVYPSMTLLAVILATDVAK
jgi:hypothetical protein